jgi:hypothetical protein
VVAIAVVNFCHDESPWNARISLGARKRKEARRSENIA